MKKVFCILLTLLLLAVLAVPAFAASIYESYVIPKGSVRMVAHRGYSAVAPENTLPSFRLAGENARLRKLMASVSGEDEEPTKQADIASGLWHNRRSSPGISDSSLPPGRAFPGSCGAFRP